MRSSTKKITKLNQELITAKSQILAKDDSLRFLDSCLSKANREANFWRKEAVKNERMFFTALDLLKSHNIRHEIH